MNSMKPCIKIQSITQRKRIISMRSSAVESIRTIEPPTYINGLKGSGNFYIKVITYEKDHENNIKRYTGYSQESDIIPKTCEFCESRSGKNSECTPPIVSTVNEVDLCDCIVAENFITESSFIHRIK
tara:strand:+ start:2305 stop:2685 length:381 start_codon:yes stop_codon:yes gene_type:complete